MTRVFKAEDPDTRTALLLGAEGAERLARARVIVFGAGGVGSWCVEALVRAGVGTITIVDSDTVEPSNLNRQLVALRSTMGQLKAHVAAEHVHDINPDCRVEAVAGIFSAATAPSFDLDSYDIIVDAIDSVAHKATLINLATRCRHARLVASMGAALKTDLSQIRTGWFADVSGDPLARALRERFKRTATWPYRRFRCVWSPQIARNHELPGLCAETAETANGRKRINGTLVTTTAAFGLELAQLAITALTARAN